MLVACILIGRFIEIIIIIEIRSKLILKVSICQTMLDFCPIYSSSLNIRNYISHVVMNLFGCK